MDWVIDLGATTIKSECRQSYTAWVIFRFIGHLDWYQKRNLAELIIESCGDLLLSEGVTENQRVICFRLAVHLRRLGFPSDLTCETLKAWARKNRPSHGKRILTDQEVQEQTAWAYSKNYRSYGCEDPAIRKYCIDECPVLAAPNNISNQRI